MEKPEKHEEAIDKMFFTLYGVNGVDGIVNKQNEIEKVIKTFQEEITSLKQEMHEIKEKLDSLIISRKEQYQARKNDSKYVISLIISIGVGVVALLAFVLK